MKNAADEIRTQKTGATTRIITGQFPACFCTTGALVKTLMKAYFHLTRCWWKQQTASLHETAAEVHKEKQQGAKSIAACDINCLRKQYGRVTANSKPAHRRLGRGAELQWRKQYVVRARSRAQKIKCLVSRHENKSRGFNSFHFQPFGQ